MWHEINGPEDIRFFMEQFDCFHDSCLTELQYVSGAYVADDLSMHPVNDQRRLRVVIQTQLAGKRMVELLFEGLRYLHLAPVDDRYTCEILGASLFEVDGCYYWCDADSLSKDDFAQYDGTIVCSEKLCWRPRP